MEALLVGRLKRKDEARLACPSPLCLFARNKPGGDRGKKGGKRAAAAFLCSLWFRDLRGPREEGEKAGCSSKTVSSSRVRLSQEGKKGKLRAQLL